MLMDDIAPVQAMLHAYPSVALDMSSPVLIFTGFGKVHTLDGIAFT